MLNSKPQKIYILNSKLQKINILKFKAPKNIYVKFKAPKNIYKSKNKIYSRIFKKKTKYIQYKKAKILKFLL